MNWGCCSTPPDLSSPAYAFLVSETDSTVELSIHNWKVWRTRTCTCAYVHVCACVTINVKCEVSSLEEGKEFPQIPLQEREETGAPEGQDTLHFIHNVI